MKNVDYLIVGFGIASACFIKHCIEHCKTFHIITDDHKSASHIAAGMYNPVILHRFNPVYEAVLQMDLLKKTFIEFEILLEDKFMYEMPVYRIFASEQEKITWQNKIKVNEVLQKYLNPKPITTSFENIHAPFGFGEVAHTGRVDMQKLLKTLEKKIMQQITIESFDYHQLDLSASVYKEISFGRIVFAEGVKVADNIFFNWVPVIKNKGETLIIEINTQLPDVIFKAANFLMPLGDNRYYLGATYDRQWDTTIPTERNKEKLISALSTFYTGDFSIIEHRTAFRPTTPDRRGITGQHPEFNNVYILNGMGTRGTFLSPLMAAMLFNHTENQREIPEEYNVSRWQKRYLQSHKSE